MRLSAREAVKRAYPDSLLPKERPVTVSMPEDYAAKLPKRLEVVVDQEEFGWIYRGPQHGVWIAYGLGTDKDNHVGTLVMAWVDQNGVRGMDDATVTFAADDVHDWAHRYIEHHQAALENRFNNTSYYVADGFHRSKLRIQ